MSADADLMRILSAVSGVRVKKEAIEFRPARPPLRKLWPLFFLSLLFLVLAPRILMEPKPWDVVGLVAMALLIAGGIWLWFRQRFPGDPTLRVDANGMSIFAARANEGLKWSEIAAIQTDFTLDRMLFVPKSGGKPIVMRMNMVSADGRCWAGLIENYWRAPKNGRATKCG